jgi:hypothetical protein
VIASGSIAVEAGRALAVFFAIAFAANVSQSGVRIQPRGVAVVERSFYKQMLAALQRKMASK